MTNQIISIAALVIAIAAVIFCFYLRRVIWEDFISVTKELHLLDKRMDDFADARMIERKEQRHAEKED